jgi:hypothetical protein
MKKFMAFFFHAVSFDLGSCGVFIVVKKTAYSSNSSKYSAFSTLPATCSLVVSMFAMRFSMNSSTLSSVSSGAVYPSGFGYRESASATTFFFPGTCLILKSHMSIALSYLFMIAPGTSAEERLGNERLSVRLDREMLPVQPYPEALQRPYYGLAF